LLNTTYLLHKLKQAVKREKYLANCEKKKRGRFFWLEQIFSSLHEAYGGNELWILMGSLYVMTIAATVVMQIYYV